MTLKYLDIFGLWNEIEKAIKRDITITEIGDETGIAHSTIRRMRVGEPSDPPKLAKVAKALYKLGGITPMPKTPVVWLDWEHEPNPPNGAPQLDF